MYKCQIQIHNGKWGQAENHTGPDNPGKGLNSHPARGLAQHHEFRPQGHHGNEQDLMAQFLYCRDVLRVYQSEGSSSSSLGKPQITSENKLGIVERREGLCSSEHKVTCSKSY